MELHELEETYHDVMDSTLNLLQHLFLLTQQMEQQLKDSNDQLEIRQQLLLSLMEIKSTGITIRTELHSFSATMEAFLAHSS